MSQSFPKYKDEMMDGRRKITSEQVEEIKRKRIGGATSVQLAREYGVSKHLVLYYTSDVVRKRIKQHAKDSWRDYYDKDQHAEAMKRYRDKKKKLKCV